jgi:hypothetical protein
VSVEVSSQTGPEALAQGGVYPCSNVGTEGIVLLNFGGGDYAWRLSGLDVAGAKQYSATGSATINGEVTVSAQLLR